jgi:CubicO group peptidase (beta-lactamase class C family)
MNSLKLLRALAASALVLAATPFARAEGTFDIPPGAHFNPDKLAKVSEFFRNEVATGKIPGAIVLIQQHGKPVYHESFGVQDVGSKAPITDQTIFRLFSMTKAITSVVAVQLVDEGKLKLDDPIAKYIPSFADVKVGIEKKAEDGTKTLELVPPTRPPTVLDLMRQTSGITYGFYGDSLVRKTYKAADIYAGDFDLAEFAERIAKLPLHNQPGALWQYGHSTDVLARIMEIVSGKSLIEIERDYFYFPGDGFGFGLGLAVRTDPGNAKPPPPGSLGELKWDGASGCYFVIDRKQDMFFVLLEQTPSERQRIQRTLKQLIYEAMEN